MPLALRNTAGFSAKAVLKKSTMPALGYAATGASRIVAPVIFLTLLLMSTRPEMKAQILPKNSTVRFLALGDSYTIGESVAELQRWPVQLAEVLKTKGYNFEIPEIIAVTGWRTDQLKRAITEIHPAENYDLVSLLIGVNNQYQNRSIEEYEAQFGDLLTIAIRHARNTAANVIVLSIPDYGYTPFGKDKQPEISKRIDAFNEVNKRIAQRHGAIYVDITHISRRGLKEPELVAEDGLHPSGEMYRMWVQEILKKIDLQ